MDRRLELEKDMSREVKLWTKAAANVSMGTLRLLAVRLGLE